VFHYRAKFLQDWTIKADLPQGGQGLWRLDVAAAGSGVSGDLLAHCIDTAMWLNGPIESLSAMTETFVKERPHTLTGKVEKVGIDDACAFLCRFANGSLATFESTRYARGHKALNTFEINGENTSLFWDLHDLHRLQVFDYKEGDSKLRGWKSVHVTDNSPDHPYMDKWWVPGLQIGYEHSFVHQVADFLEGIASGKPAMPDFRDAYRTQLVLDAIMDSAKDGTWKKVGTA
jgi:predicted dehydrogenase